MKRFLIFFAGIATGVILTFLFLFLFAIVNKSKAPLEERPGITMFDEPGDSVRTKEFKVFQVVDKEAALATCEDNGVYYGSVVLLTNDEGKLYYDDEIIYVYKGHSAKQVGIYQYSTKMGYKTVPIIKIMKTT